MHHQSISAWEHEHVFLGERHDRHERRTMLVVGLTAAMMVVEIIGGTLLGSMALVADGWHMWTHAAALGIAALAYRVARTRAHDRRFAFGTGKLGELAAFSSAIILAMIALFIGYESVMRLVAPLTIHFAEALPIACVGLLVNLASAWLLGDDHADAHDDHDHGQAHHHDQAGHDTNIRAAYVHVMADALTSVLAIIALLSGRFLNIVWLDPVMGLIGAAVILSWSASLIRTAGAVLLDVAPDEKLVRLVRDRLEIDGDRVSDLHLWRLGPGHLGAIASIVADRPQAPDVYKRRLGGIGGLAHVTIEVHACPDHAHRLVLVSRDRCSRRDGIRSRLVVLRTAGDCVVCIPHQAQQVGLPRRATQLKGCLRCELLYDPSARAACVVGREQCVSAKRAAV